MSEPGFLKRFAKQSKDPFQPSRDQVAGDVRRSREAERKAKRELPEARTELEGRRAELAERVRAFEQLGAQIEADRAQLEKLQAQAFGALKNFFEIHRVRDAIKMGERRKILDKPNVEHAQTMVEAGEWSVRTLEEQLGDPERILKSYYDREKKRWAEAPVSEEDIRESFSAEHLASLGMEDYVLLLKRFPSEMVTHVSRRGVRDQATMMYHQTGAGEVHDSFDRLLAARELRAALSMKLEDENRDAYVADMLGLDEVASREEAVRKLEQEMQRPGFHSLADQSAVHVATEWAADVYYGSERKNEVFVAFPSALIAAEYAFNGSLEKPCGDAMRNDTWIWAKESEGIPLDAGIVFLPGDARVDPRTGSRYRIEGGKAVPDVARANRIFDLAHDRSFAELLVEHARRREERDYDAAGTRERLRTEFGVEDDREAALLLGHAGVGLAKDMFPDLRGYVPSTPAPEPAERDRMLRADIDRALNANAIYYAEADAPIDGKAYWEQYFEQYPDRKPKHLVFYDGGDPTVALHTWRKENGLSRRVDGTDVSFDRRRQPEQHPGGDARDLPASGRFYEIARKIIDEKFPEV